MLTSSLNVRLIALVCSFCNSSVFIILNIKEPPLGSIPPKIICLVHSGSANMTYSFFLFLGHMVNLKFVLIKNNKLRNPLLPLINMFRKDNQSQGCTICTCSILHVVSPDLDF